MGKIDCKKIEKEIYDYVTSQKIAINKDIKLAIIDAGEDLASKKYISLKMNKAIELGIKVELVKFNSDSKIEEILNKISLLNADDSVNGIMVQLPLLEKFAPFKFRILNSISPLKDVDGLSAINFGLYSQDVLNGILPATVDAILDVLKSQNADGLLAKNILIINNSDLIGKPLSMVLSTLNATVTIANLYTDNLKDLLKSNSIIVSATGKGHLFSSKDILEDSLVIDVSTAFLDGKMIGDFNAQDAPDTINYTSVPGGIGPLTIASLFRNLVNLTKLQHSN
jgi:methylenetetrahydrofolate dehydrogenase (NADP+) / methenyltetrahydrofolate cyclohydrolase